MANSLAIIIQMLYVAAMPHTIFGIGIDFTLQIRIVQYIIDKTFSSYPPPEKTGTESDAVYTI